ncbi:MAG TPA: 16S rRNA (cytidine(1402)-2'-O)-methyltransferase [Polyangiaceae bacterium]|nr:16S rRNA (cytidine(1402)-2'-O)-methyltransferase [Polyangiaceae bacterium]
MAESAPYGTLYLVATPIGNLGDMTERALATLRSVAHIAAEDTRRTRGLLSHFGITGKELHTLDANASERQVARVVELLKAGQDVAFATDAGTPGVSDPGRALVQAAVAAGVPTISLPGASAVTTAVALSGLVAGPFVFLGFLPRQGSGRKELLQRILHETWPVVLFEAPHRIQETLSDLSAHCPSRQAAVCRELTKLHEEVLRGSLSELAQIQREWLGEIVVVLGETAPLPARGSSDDELRQQARGLVEGGASAKATAQHLAEISGRSRREVYALVLEVKGSSESSGEAE